MKHYTQKISEVLEDFGKAMSSYMDSLFDGMIKSAQSVLDKLSERFNDTEQCLEEPESEDEDNA